MYHKQDTEEHTTVSPPIQYLIYYNLQHSARFLVYMD